MVPGGPAGRGEQQQGLRHGGGQVVVGALDQAAGPGAHGGGGGLGLLGPEQQHRGVRRAGQHPPHEAGAVRSGERRVGEHDVGRPLRQAQHHLGIRDGGTNGGGQPEPCRRRVQLLGGERCPNAHENGTHCGLLSDPRADHGGTGRGERSRQSSELFRQIGHMPHLARRFWITEV